MNKEDKWRKKTIKMTNLQAKPVEILDSAWVIDPRIIPLKGVPLLQVDLEKRDDLKAVIKAHESFKKFGDVKTNWTRDKGNKKEIAIVFRFIEPVETIMILSFDIVRQGHVVDMIVYSNLLQITTEDIFFGGGINIEVKSHHIIDEWNKLYRAALIPYYRKIHRLSKKEAKEKVEKVIIQQRIKRLQK